MAQRLRQTLTDEIEQVGEYCTSCEWTNDIKKFVSSWSNKQVKEWKAASGAYQIEEQLNKIRAWTESIKTNVDKRVVTRSMLIRVDASCIEETLVPSLDAVFADICETTLREINADSLAFKASIQAIIDEFDQTPQDIQDFADYASRVLRHKEDMSMHEGRIASIKALIDVVRINYRVLNVDEEQLDQECQELWRHFLFRLQEANQFVSTQSPSIIEQLDELYQVRETTQREREAV